MASGTATVGMTAGVAFVVSLGETGRDTAAATAVPRLVPAPLLEKADCFAIFVLYVEDVLALPATAYGALLATGAAGGLAGVAVADRLVAGRRHRQVVTWSVAVSAGTPVLLAEETWAAVVVVVTTRVRPARTLHPERGRRGRRDRGMGLHRRRRRSLRTGRRNGIGRLQRSATERLPMVMVFCQTLTIA